MKPICCYAPILLSTTPYKYSQTISAAQIVHQFKLVKILCFTHLLNLKLTFSPPSLPLISTHYSPRGFLSLFHQNAHWIFSPTVSVAVSENATII